jgi:hypothetical protein
VHENYNANLGKMSGIDAWENITVNSTTKALLQTRDADFRRGVPFAPIGNALEPGKWQTYSCSDSLTKTAWGQEGSANCVHSALWLGVLVGDFRMSLQWIALPGFWNTSVSTYSKQIGRFGLEIDALVSTVGAPFDTVKPTVTVKHVSPDFAFDYPVVRAGAWRSADAVYCVTVVAVNTWQEMNVSFGLQITGVPIGTKVTRMFAYAPAYNSSFSIQLSDSGEFADLLTAGNAQIYQLGCDNHNTTAVQMKTNNALGVSATDTPVTSKQVRFMGRSLKRGGQVREGDPKANGYVAVIDNAVNSILSGKLLGPTLKTDDIVPPMIDIFVHGDGGFPCWRVPAVVLATSTGRLFAFAEARNYSGDGCEPVGLKPNASHPNEGPRSLALRTSTNSGKNWGAIRIVDWNGINPAVVYDERTDKVIVHYPAAYWSGGTGHPSIGGGYTKQLICSSDGLCGAPTPTVLYWPGCSPTPDPHCQMHVGAGPGLGVQLTQGPHAGRLLFAGHAGQVDVVWYSDDAAKTWTVSDSTYGSNNKTEGVPFGQFGCGRHQGCFDEPFPVQLPNGNVQLDMRNDSLTCDPTNCCCAALDITHPRSVADSTDGGLTFGPVYQQHDLTEPTGGCQASSIVVGTTVLFSNPSSGSSNRSLLTLRRSQDSGKTYPPDMATLVWPGAGGYSCLTRLANSTATVGLVFERSAPGCKGGSCRISFVSMHVLKMSGAMQPTLTTDPPGLESVRAAPSPSVAATGSTASPTAAIADNVERGGTGDSPRPTLCSYDLSWEPPVTIRHSTKCFAAMGQLARAPDGNIIVGIGTICDGFPSWHGGCSGVNCSRGYVSLDHGKSFVEQPKLRGVANYLCGGTVLPAAGSTPGSLRVVVHGFSPLQKNQSAGAPITAPLSELVSDSSGGGYRCVDVPPAGNRTAMLRGLPTTMENGSHDATCTPVNPSR